MDIGTLLNKATGFNKSLAVLYEELFGIDRNLANELNINGGKIIIAINEAAVSESMRGFIQKISQAYTLANKTLQILDSIKELRDVDREKLTNTETQCYELIQLLSTFMSSTHIRRKR